MNKSESIKELMSALSKAQAEIKSAEKDKINPHFKSKYSSEEAIWEACRNPLTKHNLAVSHTCNFDENGTFLETILAHGASGEYIISRTPLFGINNMQNLGSAESYAKRYALSAIAGVPTGEDDDAEKTMNRPIAPKPLTNYATKPTPSRPPESRP